MRRRPSRLVAVTAAVLALAGCEARVYGTAAGGPRCAAADRRRPAGPAGPPARGPARRARRVLRRPGGRTKQATADAAAKGADITTVVLDRSTGQRVTNGNGRGIAIASVVKLFIADDLLLRGPTAVAGRPEDVRVDAALLRRQRRRGVLEPRRRQRDRHPGRRPLRPRRHPAAGQRPMVQHHQHGRRPGALLRHDAVRRGRPAHGEGRHDRRQPGRSPLRPGSTE